MERILRIAALFLALGAALPAFAQDLDEDGAQDVFLLGPAKWEIGTPVEFTLRNSSKGDVYIDVAQVLTSREVVRNLSIYEQIHVRPGKSKVIRWDQKDDSGKPVTHGMFRIHLVFVSSETDMVWDIERDFDLNDAKGKGPILFRTTKTSYRVGEKVEFYLRNRSTAELHMKNDAMWRIHEDRQGGKLIFAPTPKEGYIVVAAKAGERKWSWNQIGFRNTPAPAGAYKLRISFQHGQSGPSEFKTMKFKIR